MSEGESTKLTHTPGPWRVGERYMDMVDVWSENGAGYLVARATCGEVPGEANARVIAAAPELLAFVYKLAYHFIEPADITQARELLKRIDGNG